MIHKILFSVFALLSVVSIANAATPQEVNQRIRGKSFSYSIANQGKGSDTRLTIDENGKWSLSGVFAEMVVRGPMSGNGILGVGEMVCEGPNECHNKIILDGSKLVQLYYYEPSDAMQAGIRMMGGQNEELSFVLVLKYGNTTGKEMIILTAKKK